MSVKARLPLDRRIDPATLPDVYGLQVSGECMAPDYTDGSFVGCCKSLEIKQNDVVVVWYRLEILKPGSAQCILKRIIMLPMTGVTFPYREHPNSEIRALVMLGRDDMPDKMLPVRCEHILAMHKCIGPLKPEQVAL